MGRWKSSSPLDCLNLPYRRRRVSLLHCKTSGLYLQASDFLTPLAVSCLSGAKSQTGRGLACKCRPPNLTCHPSCWCDSSHRAARWLKLFQRSAARGVNFSAGQPTERTNINAPLPNLMALANTLTIATDDNVNRTNVDNLYCVIRAYCASYYRARDTLPQSAANGHPYRSRPLMATL